jgi:hypothetical protein
MPELRHIPRNPQQDRSCALAQQIAQQSEEARMVQRVEMGKVGEKYEPLLCNEAQNQHQERDVIPVHYEFP